MYPSTSSGSGWEMSLPNRDEVAIDLNQIDSPSPAITDEAVRSDDSVLRLAEAMSSALRGISSTHTLPRVVKGNVIPVFNPEDKNQNIEDWCAKVDEIRQMFHWSDEVTIFNALPKLEGLAKVWYRGLRSVKYSWDEWKLKLARAFPAQRDYCEALEEMLRRKKRSTETFAQYFYEKQALLSACKISGKDAVSCVIGGIAEAHIRAGAKAANCADPESLFDYLRCLNDDVVASSSRQGPFRFSDRKRKAESGRKAPVCYNCNKPGHVKKDCRAKKGEKRVVRCFVCQEEGHIALNCTKKRKQQESTK